MRHLRYRERTSFRQEQQEYGDFLCLGGIELLY